MIEYEYSITFAQLAMAMFAMGATLHVGDFRAVVRLPRSFLTGLIAQMVLVPLLAYGLLRAVDLDPGVAIGMGVLRRWPDRAQGLSGLALAATTVLIAVIVVGSATAGRLDRSDGRVQPRRRGRIRAPPCRDRHRIDGGGFVVAAPLMLAGRRVAVVAELREG